MKLTTDQIARLFTFCEKHLVFYYEVQTELVDHLANAIEQKMEANTKITFEEALNRVYADFGIMGFVPIVREKEAQTRRTVKKMYWNLVKAQFGWPQILAFLVLSGIFFTITSWNLTVGVVAILFLSAAGVITTLYHQLALTKYIRQSEKRFLLATYGQGFQTGLFCFYLICQMMIHTDFFWELPLLLSILGAFWVITFLAKIQLVSQVKKRLTEQFPQIFTPQVAA